jgi:DNA-binding CsgD family transcriptional regulator
MLSQREKQLLRRLAKGKSDGEIAAQIGGTERQIGVQRKRLIDKLQIHSQAQLTTLAKQLAAWPSRPRHLRVGSGKTEPPPRNEGA